MSKKICIIGCGVAGLETALRLKSKVKDKAEVTVINDGSFFSYRPWLRKTFKQGEQVTVNLEFLLSSKDIRFIDGFESVDMKKKTVKTSQGVEEFDFAIFAPEREVDYSLKGSSKALHYETSEDAQRIRDNIRKSLEKSKEAKGKEKESLRTIVVYGGDKVAVELACELNEFLESACDECGVRRIDVKLVLAFPESKILSGLPLKASKIAERHLSRQGIELKPGTRVEEVGKDVLKTTNGSINSASIIWCGDTKNPGWYSKLVETDNDNNILVNPYLQTTTEATAYALGGCVALRKVNYRREEKFSLSNVVREARMVASNMATNVNGGEKKYFDYKRMPVWVSLGNSNALLSWKDKVLSGKIINFLSKLREGHYLRRWK